MRENVDSCSYNRFQSGSIDSAVCSRRATALVIWRYTFSSRSAQALSDSCLFLLSRKKYSSRNFVISGIVGRQISSRICHSRYSSPNHSRRYLLFDLWIRFHVFHFSQQTVAPHVLSPVSVQTFSSRLCTNDTVQRNHRMSLDPQPGLPVCLSLSTLVLSQSSATNADTTGYLSHVRVSDSSSNGVTVHRCTCSSTECRGRERLKGLM